MKKYLFLLIICILSARTFSQPFADVLSANYQTFSSVYTDSAAGQKNKTDDYFLNFFLPKVFKNGNTLLIRLNGETMNSTISPDSSYSSRVSSVSLPLGFKFVTKNKKWETIVIGVPKIASDFRDKIDSYDWQFGGIFLEQYVPNERLKVKLGLYYNTEAFGNFFMPLVGVDWKINKRMNLYGIIPSNYRFEVNIIKDKLYTGLCYKAATRSFRLSQKNNYDYVRYDEQQIKLFLDCFVYKKIMLFAEVGYSVGKNPLGFYNGSKKDINYNNPVYTPLKSYPVFNFGIAYRVRLDLENKGREEEIPEAK
jgi:outer membrane receptor protein involved in Fe transport